MARVGVSITKTTTFRGVAQEFANTYYYDAPEPISQAVCTAAINLLTTKEKANHSSQVNFIRGRAWSAGGSPATNNMIADIVLTGAGSQAANSSLDKERAFLVRFRAGVDSKGRPVYLRKWWHLDILNLAATAISSGQMQNTAQLSTTQRSAIEAMGDDIKTLSPAGAGGTWNLVSENGRAISGATQAHPYIEHHQLGDMWRG